MAAPLTNEEVHAVALAAAKDYTTKEFSYEVIFVDKYPWERTRVALAALLAARNAE